MDTSSIKIGEQIKYRISVQADTTDKVVFPEGQSFLPLEMVEATAVDTSGTKVLQRLMKTYALTKFDSGTYTIPVQKMVINGQIFTTDSFQVVVKPVIVDTTKQKLYLIKPAISIPPSHQFPKWIWWVLIGVIALVIIGWLFFRRKRKKEEAKKNIPPFEKAMLALKELDHGKLLEENEVKTYYSKLTDTARRYLDEQVDDRAMESTSEELILRLQLKKDAGKLNIDQKIIDDFKHILQRADLAKFARSKPHISIAQEDRLHIEKIIIDTKLGIPEPTEEELQKDEKYRLELEEKQQRKRKQKRWIISTTIVLTLIIAALFLLGGPTSFTNRLFGNTTKIMLQQEWITSEYGNPSVRISTPAVLVRQEADSSAAAKLQPHLGEIFSSGELLDELYVRVGILKKQKENTDTTASIISMLKTRGAQNIVVKKEDFSTAAGIEGQKTKGNFSISKVDGSNTLEKKFVILNFNYQGALQQVMIVANKNDEYADKIMSRIEYSVELIKSKN